MGSERRAPSRRTVVRVAAVVVALALAYAVVVTLYAFSGSVTALGPSQPEPENGGVTVVLNVEGVDAAHQRIDLSVHVEPSSSLFTGGRLVLASDIHVIVSPIDGSQSLVFPADSVLATKPVKLIADGEIGNWPFDGYRTDQLVVLAYVTSGGVERPIPTQVWFSGDVPGWRVDVAAKGAMPTTLPTTLAGAVTEWPHVDVKATRSGSTVAFAFVLLALLVVMPCLVLFVAITAFRGRRKLEPSFMGWMGAMLFATIPLRTFLPGSPPIGSWIDFTVVLWVVAGLVVGLAIYVAAWARWSHPDSAG
ncbi:DUF4436 domain-containing protein [Humibacter antri]